VSTSTQEYPRSGFNKVAARLLDAFLGFVLAKITMLGDEALLRRFSKGTTTA
jgi:hypothetical protein